jgi:outer membrane protein
VPLYNHTLGLSVQLELFDGLRRFNSLRAAGAQQGAADAAFTTQRYAVMLDTKRFFYTALANEALVTVQEAQVRRAQQQLQISIEKLRAGSATRSDSLRSTVDYGNARIQLLQARANLATAQANLGRQIGVDELVRAAGDTGLPAFPDTASLRAGAIAHAPAVQQSDAELRAARAQVMATRSQYLPSVTVSYNDNRQGVGWPQFTGFDNYAENYTWRFGLQWTLFNGFSRETQQVSASVTRDVAEARAADARLSVSAQLTQQLALVSTTFEQIAIADANRAAATEDLRVQQERYRVGAATILDLLTSQAALTQAEVNTVQTRFNYLIARAQVEAIVGRAL